MDCIVKFLIILLKCFIVLEIVSAETYHVKIGTSQHINTVDSKFLSFTIEPKYLFSTNEKYNSKECLCMASSLTPAYIRIAGPSTSHMTFQNATISIDDLDPVQLELKKQRKGPKKIQFNNLVSSHKRASSSKSKSIVSDTVAPFTVTNRQYKRFVQWANSTGFDLVFALNNNEKTDMGLWDPNTALNVLTIAENSDIGQIFWELGYECNNQSIEEYFNDLQTLKVITETFPPGRTGQWRVVGGDVSKCLNTESKSDFKDYIMLSNDMMDALLLNGNSSSRELSRMSQTDRIKLLRLLSNSTTPLWLTENAQQRYTELERVADWITSLGYSAKNGFSVHFRELVEEELYEPTLSFYMALLFKNLVGERVLDVEMESEQATLFAHCTSLRHKAVPGAVTIYGMNMADDPARFALKLSKRQEGGDIMQFILGHDSNGNIVVNGRAMYYEGDIRPVVKRMRPYKTLLINLPAKSFGFWVLANTQVEACNYTDELKANHKQQVEPVSVDDVKENDITDKKYKRSLKELDVINGDYSPFVDYSEESMNKKNMLLENKSENVNEIINDLNSDLKNIRKLLETKEGKQNKKRHTEFSRHKRQLLNEIAKNDEHNILGRHALSTKHNIKDSLKYDTEPRKGLFKKFILSGHKYNDTKSFRNKKLKRLLRINKNKLGKRDMQPKVKSVENLVRKPLIIDYKENAIRSRRSILNDKYHPESNEENKDSSENEVSSGIKHNVKLGKLLRNLQNQFLNIPVEVLDGERMDTVISDSDSDVTDIDDNRDVQIEESHDYDSMEISESDEGFLKSFGTLISLLGELNKNLSKFWNIFRILE